MASTSCRAGALRPIHAAAVAFLFTGLYLTTRVNYLLFHSLAELFSIVVAASLFLVAWNSRRYIRNPYLMFVGIAYLFIGLLDLLHTLAYKGMPIFRDYDYYANQLWIGARYIESLSLLVAFLFLERGWMPRPGWVFGAYTAVTALVVVSIFTWKVFPVCFVEGVGLTPFKKISEYVICLILSAATCLLRANRGKFDPGVYRLLMGSLVCTIFSELAFTFYISNYGFSNLVGHYFKLISFFLVYLAIVKTGVEAPYELIFRELTRANRSLEEEVASRRKTEKEREKLIGELQGALEEIKTLEGILPICMHCKKIRDDRGYWKQLEQYLHDHSEARFSHGICPECLDRHYPELC